MLLKRDYLYRHALKTWRFDDIFTREIITFRSVTFTFAYSFDCVDQRLREISFRARHSSCGRQLRWSKVERTRIRWEMAIFLVSNSSRNSCPFSWWLVLMQVCDLGGWGRTSLYSRIGMCHQYGRVFSKKSLKPGTNIARNKIETGLKD